MSLRPWIAVVALVAVTSYAASGLLEAEPVPVAPKVVLSGTAPQPRPPSEGFLIVPPQVIDFSDADPPSGSDPDERLEDDSDERLEDDSDESLEDDPDDSPDDD